MKILDGKQWKRFERRSKVIGMAVFVLQMVALGVPLLLFHNEFKQTPVEGTKGRKAVTHVTAEQQVKRAQRAALNLWQKTTVWLERCRSKFI